MTRKGINLIMLKASVQIVSPLACQKTTRTHVFMFSNIFLIWCLIISLSTDLEELVLEDVVQSVELEPDADEPE